MLVQNFRSPFRHSIVSWVDLLSMIGVGTLLSANRDRSQISVAARHDFLANRVSVGLVWDPETVKTSTVFFPEFSDVSGIIAVNFV